MKHISVSDFKEVVQQGAHDPTVAYINVCTPAEYRERHIKGVRNIPLDSLGTHVDELNKKKTVYIHCRSGNRSRKAIEKLRALGVTAELVNVEGGLMAWQEAGHETHSLTNRLPIIRQVLIGAGGLVLVGLMLAHFVSSTFLVIPLFVSLGLLVSGVTGWCGMAVLLNKMPWNK